MQLPDTYRQFLSKPGPRTAMGWSVLGRLPLYLTALAVALLSIERKDSLVTTGGLLAAYSVGSAVAGPLVARWMDRRGQAVPLIATAVTHVVSLATFSLTVAPTVGQVALMAVAGATIPPTSASVRALWGTLPLGEDGRRGAYALEAVLGEVFVIAGPIGLSAALLVSTPTVALIVGSCMTAAGAMGLATTGVSRAWRAEESEGGRHILGPLSKPAFVGLLAVMLTAAAAAGTFSLLIPVFAENEGSADQAGLLFGCWGIGSVIGGLWFGRRKPSTTPITRQFLIALGLVTIGLALPILARDVPTMIAALAVGGVAIAPLSIVEYELIQRMAPKAYITEAFTWVQTANVGGSAIGAQVTGLVVAAKGITAGLWLAPLCGAVAVLLTLGLAKVWNAAAIPAPADAEEVTATR
ncbi:hypothetical protein ACOCJ7_08350 [Knoellia sp. CPCC 206453]|uniref:hypothetical protein n=1 Tax=Knoellia pratensis TaxID=3404796 RepID=UPI00360685CA